VSVLSAHGPYAAWASWLDAFAQGEDLPAHHLVPVDEQLGAQMRGRLLIRVEAAFRARAGLWADGLRRHLDAAPARRPSELRPVLAAARNRLQPLRTLAADPRLSEDVRTALADALRAMVTEAQESLENSARRQPQAAEEILAVVRENHLLAALTSPNSAATPHPQSQASFPAGRRVIL
jgi:hypothetical protein